MGRPPIGERAMTTTERSRRYRAKMFRDRERRRCNATVAIRFPALVRQAIEQAAARNCCSLSDVIPLLARPASRMLSSRTI